jgi:hypothetical protein
MTFSLHEEVTFAGNQNIKLSFVYLVNVGEILKLCSSKEV